MRIIKVKTKVDIYDIDILTQRTSLWKDLKKMIKHLGGKYKKCSKCFKCGHKYSDNEELHLVIITGLGSRTLCKECAKKLRGEKPIK